MYCFSKFCLLCTTETENLVYLHTRSDFDISTNYMDMIEVLYPKLIELNSSLPDFICKICLGELLNSYLFYQKCQRTERILIKYMKDMLVPQENTNKRKLQYSEEISTEFFFQIKKMKYSQSLTRSNCSNNLEDLDYIDTDFKSLDHISNASTILLADYENEIEKRISKISEKIGNLILSTEEISEENVNNINAIQNIEKNDLITVNNLNTQIEETNSEKSIKKSETVVYLGDISETESDHTKSTDYMTDDSDYSSEITNTNSDSNGLIDLYTIKESKEIKSSLKETSENVTKRHVDAESRCTKKNITIEFPEFDESLDTADLISPGLHNTISDIVLSLEFDNETIAISKNSEIINNNNHSTLELNSISKTISYTDNNTCNNETDCNMTENSENKSCRLETERFLKQENNSEVTKKIKDKNKTLQSEFKSMEKKAKTFGKEINNETPQQKQQKILVEATSEHDKSSIKETNNNNEVINTQQQNKKKIVELKSEHCINSVKKISSCAKTIAQQNKNKTHYNSGNDIKNNSSTTIISQQCKTQQLKSTNNYNLVKKICEKIISEKQQSKLKFLNSKRPSGVQISLTETNNRELTISHIQQPKPKCLESRNKTSNVTTCKNVNNQKKISQQQQQPSTTRKLKSKNETSIKSCNNAENNSDQIIPQQQKHQIKMAFKSKNDSEKSVKEVNNCGRTIHKKISTEEKFESISENDVQNSFRKENNRDKKISEVLNLTKTFSEIEVLPLKEHTVKKILKNDDVSLKKILNLPEIAISICNNKTP